MAPMRKEERQVLRASVTGRDLGEDLAGRHTRSMPTVLPLRDERFVRNLHHSNVLAVHDDLTEQVDLAPAPPLAQLHERSADFSMHYLRCLLHATKGPPFTRCRYRRSGSAPQRVTSTESRSAPAMLAPIPRFGLLDANAVFSHVPPDFLARAFLVSLSGVDMLNTPAMLWPLDRLAADLAFLRLAWGACRLSVLTRDPGISFQVANDNRSPAPRAGGRFVNRCPDTGWRTAAQFEYGSLGCPDQALNHGIPIPLFEIQRRCGVRYLRTREQPGPETRTFLGGLFHSSFAARSGG
jgi:hypothetical protein